MSPATPKRASEASTLASRPTWGQRVARAMALPGSIPAPPRKPTPPRSRGGVPGWITWCVVAPLTLACPPVFAPLLVMCLIARRDD